jgi:aminoglycoside 6'-N-acetyltransferase I
MAYTISDLSIDQPDRIRQAAAILVEGFAEHWPASWPTMESALAEVRDSFGAGRISRIACNDEGEVLGWIGGISTYDGRVWELHPLVVKPEHQGRGIGRALVADLEDQVAERGGLTLWLGSDDVDGMTTLAGVDLFPDLLGHLGGIGNLRGHPYEFYTKLGFSLSGVMPDANGPGKPDIFLAKRVRRTSST